MNDELIALIESKKRKSEADNVHKPLFFRIYKQSEKKLFEHALEHTPGIHFHDEITSQLRELVRSLHPAISFSEEVYATYIEKQLNGLSAYEYGVWIYYPWSNRMVHTLDEQEFIQVRTNRNTYKITPEERDLLASKKVGVVGLSVGQSVALTMAMERCCGELRLADFDALELTNLNRIRTSIYNLGVNKAVSVAREIAEIDPYIKTVVFDKGITKGTIQDFMFGEGKLDLVIDECDSLDIKILLRTYSKEHGIPVIMDTSDRGMVDIERFDLEADRPILHGLIHEDIDTDSISTLSQQQKMALVFKIIDGEHVSERLKFSLNEIGKTINTWPQLASSVIIGGGVVTDVSRRIFLNTHQNSGRYYVDIEQLI